MDNTIYVGKYLADNKIPESGVIRLSESKIIILSHYLGVNVKTHEEWIDDRATIVIADKDFWPVIIKLTDNQLIDLICAGMKILKYRFENNMDLNKDLNRNNQYIEEIT